VAGIKGKEVKKPQYYCSVIIATFAIWKEEDPVRNQAGSCTFVTITVSLLSFSSLMQRVNKPCLGYPYVVKVCFE
jgi:hypothetical protein